ncbi:hypothetical protein EGT74_02955 [Chitinophaga lutea]|uniref:Uncharacterized protein n=1 Tax=Chitinophaga lutea TaxID=2488634 RepID=A0A3N4PX87_9BACT|nr:hypothetical protein EGT74_02955 [Chitinophaga lutea]
MKADKYSIDAKPSSRKIYLEFHRLFNMFVHMYVHMDKHMRKYDKRDGYRDVLKEWCGKTNRAGNC